MAAVALCLWVVAAAVLQALLSGRRTWVAAAGLVATGVPLLAWLGATMGPWWVAAALAAMASILRWPLRHAVRRLVGAFR